MALLEFAFRDLPHFVGTIILLFVVLDGLRDIAKALRGRS